MEGGLDAFLLLSDRDQGEAGVPAWVSAILHPKEELNPPLFPGERKLTSTDCLPNSRSIDSLRESFLIPLNR